MKKRLLTMLVLLIGTVTGAMATEYVTDLMLIGSGSSATKVKQQYLDQGWIDTNYGPEQGLRLQFYQHLPALQDEYQQG